MITKPLTQLIKKDMLGAWGEKETEAMRAFIDVAVFTRCLMPIDYLCKHDILVEVDSLYISVQWATNHKIPSRFSSLTWNPHEMRYSQSKLELFGLFHSLCQLQPFVYGIPNLKVLMDVQYVKGMLTHPVEVPSTTMSQWREGILHFSFTLIHVPKECLLVPDMLSRQPRVTRDNSDGDTGDSDHEQEYNCLHMQFRSTNTIY